MNRKFRFFYDGDSLVVEEKMAVTTGGKNRKWYTERVEIKPHELQRIIRADTKRLFEEANDEQEGSEEDTAQD